MKLTRILKFSAGSTRAVLLLSALYLLAGLLFGALAGRAASHQGTLAWRLAAWAVSAIGFGAHIAYEQTRLGLSPRITALHAAAAAGLGAFGLAAAANVHALTTSVRPPSLVLVLSLAIWPALIALPAFIVALVVGAGLAGLRRRFGSSAPPSKRQEGV